MRGSRSDCRYATFPAGAKGFVVISGSAAYSTLLLSCLVILLGAALVRRTVFPSLVADRWAISSGILIALQVLWLVASFLSPSSALVAPLQRLMTVLVAGLLGWAALGRTAGASADRAVTGVILASGVLFLASVVVASPTEAFNTSALDQAWSWLGLGVGAAALGALLIRRPPLWGLFAFGLAFLCAGQAAHIATLPADATSAPFILLGAVSAAPIFTLGAVATLLRESPPPRDDRSASQRIAMERSIRGFLGLTSTESAVDYAAALTEAIGTLLRAEYCLLLTPPSGAGGLTIGAGFNLIRDSPLTGAPLDPKGCPVIVQAMNLGRSVHLPGGTHSPDSGTVLKALGLGGKAPALLVPLLAHGESVAGLLLLSPHAEREWDDDTRQLLESAAPALGERLYELIRRPRRSPEPADDHRQLEEAGRRIDELEAKLEAAAREENSLQGIEDLRAQLEESRLAIEILEAESERLRSIPFPGKARPEGAIPDRTERLQAELSMALQALAESRASGEPAEARPFSTFAPSDGFLASLQEVRQPLSAISGYTELLLGESMGLLGAAQRRFLQRIRSAVRRLDQELAAMTRALSGLSAVTAREPSDLAALIEQALEVIHDDLHVKGLTVRLDLPSAPIPITLDPDSIRTIVARLLSNAAEASPDGREVSLRLTPAPAERVVILTVSDLGQGVPPADLSRVFSGSLWRDPVQGLGQDAPGLALVKSLAESIGGRVWVESQDGGGTTFSVVLPSG